MFQEDRFYATKELVEFGQRGLFPVRTMTTLNKLIRAGRIKAVNIGAGDKATYKIKGSDVNEFLTTYHEKNS